MINTKERVKNLKKREIILHTKHKCTLEFTLICSILDVHDISYKMDACDGSCQEFVYFILNKRGYRINEACNSLEAQRISNGGAIFVGEFENLVTVVAHGILDNNGDCSRCTSSLTF